MNDMNVGLILLALVAFIVILFVFMAIKMVNQGYTYVVERLGRYHKTLTPGLHFLFPFVDSIRERIDMREQVVPFPPQPVITSDNINVSIDTVIYYQVTNPIAATYEIADPMAAIEQLAVTTLRNIIGTMDMEQALTGRDQINGQLRGQLDEATGRWGIRVSRVELKAIRPGRDGTADEGRARPPRRDPHGRGRQAVRRSDGRGREAVRYPQGRGAGPVDDLEGPGRGASHPPGLRRHPPRQRRSQAPLLRVHQDPSANRQLLVF